VIVFLAYDPELPGIPNPQQHVRPPEPPAPQTSIIAVPTPGERQQKQPLGDIFVLTLASLYIQTRPVSRFSSEEFPVLASLVCNTDFNDAIF
jgi:hypothetical protein